MLNFYLVIFMKIVVVGFGIVGSNFVFFMCKFDRKVEIIVIGKELMM